MSEKPSNLSTEVEKGVVVLKKPDAIICDIEGTTTSIRFWEECLGPVVWLNTRECLKNEWDLPEVHEVIVMLRKQMTKNAKALKGVYELPNRTASPDVWIVQIFKYFKHCVDSQQFTEDIISLQVLVSFYCYKNKICQGHVYEDAKNAFKRWKENGINIGVFSSGISIVQQMLFCYSNFGNLHPYINEFFSSTVDGEKTNPASFNRLCRQFGSAPSAIIYVSDNPKECAAANDAGLFPILIIRSHNADLLNKINKIPFKYIQNFDQLRFVAMS